PPPCLGSLLDGCIERSLPRRQKAAAQYPVHFVDVDGVHVEHVGMWKRLLKVVTELDSALIRRGVRHDAVVVDYNRVIGPPASYRGARPWLRVDAIDPPVAGLHQLIRGRLG